MRRCLAVLFVITLVACGSDSKDSAGRPSTSASTSAPATVRAETIRLVSHDSFAVSDAVLKEFTDRTGITVELVKGGDAGAVVNQTILTKDHPQGDVLYGIDNTLLSRGLDDDLFEPYRSADLTAIDSAFDLDSSQHRVTPIDESDVCLNYDKRVVTPTSLDDLEKPEFKDKVVVENPATSSTGLAFLVATVSKYGEDHYLDYWRALKAPERGRSWCPTPRARRRTSSSPIHRRRPQTSVSSTMRATARSSSPVSSRAPRTRTRPTHSSTSCCPRRSKRTCR